MGRLIKAALYSTESKKRMREDKENATEVKAAWERAIEKIRKLDPLGKKSYELLKKIEGVRK